MTTATSDRLGELIHTTPGLAAHVEVPRDDHAVAVDRCASWTIEATIRPDLDVESGVIAAVTECRLDCVRALVIRRGQLAVLGHSWRGGLALWATLGWSAAGDEVHLAATSEERRLCLYADGQLAREFTDGALFPGYEQRQELVVGEPASFYQETLPGWPGGSRHIASYNRALRLEELQQHARVALGIPEPGAPAPRPPRPPDPVGCSIPSHQPAWRPDGDHLRCLLCVAARGCKNDGHQPYWVPAGNGDPWALVCTICETAGRHTQPTPGPTH